MVVDSYIFSCQEFLNHSLRREIQFENVLKIGLLIYSDKVLINMDKTINPMSIKEPHNMINFPLAVPRPEDSKQIFVIAVPSVMGNDGNSQVICGEL